MKNKSSYQLLQDKFNSTQSQLNEVKNELDKKKNSMLISKTIPFQQTMFRTRQDISTFRSSVQSAENIYYPNRLEYLRLLKDVMLDAHLSAAIQNRKAFILSSDFVINKNNKEIEEFNDLIKTKWFYDFISLSLDSIYYGYSLIEFGDRIGTDFQCVKLVPREYVKPEFNIVTKNTSDITGINYLDKPYSDWCIGVGESHDLGLLLKAAPYVLWKKGASMSYAEFCEMFGNPIRLLYTDIYDAETRAMGENFMRNLGSSAYAVLGKDDKVEFAESKMASGAEGLFNGLIDKMNQELSKLIMGGTSMMDEKAFVGSAKVHQDNFSMINNMDKIFIENILKYQLQPFLIKHGFPLEGCTIELKQDSELSLDDSFKIDAELLKYYSIPAEYFNSKYGTKVEDITPKQIIND
jgi:hypothetical protein